MKRYIYVYYTYLCVCLPAYISAPHERPTPDKGQKRVSAPLKLEFQMIINHCVDARNQTQVLYQNKCS